eukprot:902012-Pelagomonas_calceolata.AAC.1
MDVVRQAEGMRGALSWRAPDLNASCAVQPVQTTAVCKPEASVQPALLSIPMLVCSQRRVCSATLLCSPVLGHPWHLVFQPPLDNRSWRLGALRVPLPKSPCSKGGAHDVHLPLQARGAAGTSKPLSQGFKKGL